MVKKYWDIILGMLTGLALSVFADGNIDQIQLCSSVVILLLISIGFFRIVKQSIDKQKKKKTIEADHNLIYDIVDHQKPVQAISLAQDPTKVGEEAGKKFIKFMEVIKKIMKKLAEFFDKFKGYILTISLAVLTVIEMCSGFINGLAGGVLTIEGIEILPIITFALTTVVGIISNGYSKEDAAKIKAVLNKKSAVNETIKVEIKKSIKTETEAINNLNKSLKTAQRDISEIDSEIEALKNTYSAKQEMYNMIPQLATINDVNEAHNAILDAENRKSAKEAEIAEINSLLEIHTTKLDALKSQV